MSLREFVRASINAGPCNCLSTGPDRTVNVGINHILLNGTPDAEEFKRLIGEHQGLNGAEIDPLSDEAIFDFVTIGAWLGDQETAFYFIGLGDLLGLWHCYLDSTVLLVSNKHWDEATKGAGAGDESAPEETSQG